MADYDCSVTDDGRSVRGPGRKMMFRHMFGYSVVLGDYMEQIATLKWHDRIVAVGLHEDINKLLLAITIPLIKMPTHQYGGK